MKKEEEDIEPKYLHLEKDTLSNTHFRNVIATFKGLQIVLMSINKNIPNEIHPNTDQFIRVEKGRMLVKISSSSSNKKLEKGFIHINNGNTIDYYVNEGESFTVPRGTYHEIVNITPNNKPLKVYTIYSKQMHKPHLIQEEGEKEDEEEEELLYDAYDEEIEFKLSNDLFYS